MFGDVMMT